MGGGDYDVSKGEHFEDFDVMQEPEPEPEASVETLGALSESEDQMKSLMQARDELEQRLMQQPSVQTVATADEEVYSFGNIVGVGIGEKEVDGHPTGQLAVKVLVKEKMKSAQIASEAAVPEALGGVRTDVEATGEIRAQMFTARRRPAPGGVSIGNCRRQHAGTLGCLVTRQGQLFILSNNHVMAVVNTSPLNEGISQPGRLDGGVCPNDIIARLTQFIPINFAPGECNIVDAAIARTSPNLVDRRILRPGGVLQSLAAPIQAPPVLNSLVQKSGRTTQYRRGIIDLINVTVNVDYAPIAGVARFCRQFRVRGVPGPFSDRGDSGSVVTTFPANRPVGLLFAGNAAANRTFCNPIREVLAAFGVSIVF
jgi:hypothetical protein